MRRLRVDAAAAEEGYADMLRGVDRKPMPSLEGMRNLQRLLKAPIGDLGHLQVPLPAGQCVQFEIGRAHV